MSIIGIFIFLVSGPVLWSNVEYGMTVENLHLLYPKQEKSVKWLRYKTELKNALRVGSCTITVNIDHPEGVVTSVDVHGDYNPSTNNYCADEALAGLISTYGTPASQQTVKEEGWGERKASTWVTVRAAIDYRRSENGYWNITYRPVATGL